jgi:hypothetical protein
MGTRMNDPQQRLIQKLHSDLQQMSQRNGELERESAEKSDEVKRLTSEKTALHEEIEKLKRLPIKQSDLYYPNPKPSVLPNATISAAEICGPASHGQITAISYVPGIDAKDFDPALKDLMIQFEDRISLLIESYSANGYHGLVVKIHNGNSHYIDEVKAYVSGVSPWSRTHNRFLPYEEFGRLEVQYEPRLRPMGFQESPKFLVKYNQAAHGARLLVGKENNTPLIWPNGEQVDAEIWNLILDVTYPHLSDDGNQALFCGSRNLLIRWPRGYTNIMMKNYPQKD